MQTTTNDKEPMLLFTLQDVRDATKLDASTVLVLMKKGFFPQPLHMYPPVWAEDQIVEWTNATARAARTKSCVTIQRRRRTRA